MLLVLISSVNMKLYIFRFAELINTEYPEGKRLLGRLGRRWEDNIVTDPKDMGLGGMGA